MLKDEIALSVKQAIVEAGRRGLLPSVALPEIAIEHPQNPAHGDYACSFPLKLARVARVNPLDIAQKVVNLLPSIPKVEKIEVAPPGFINFFLKDKWLTQQVDSILEARENYGNLDIGKGLRIQIEFVSVNPTGPLHVGHGRGATLGSTLANVLTAAGYTVEKEYYINDAGAQMDAFYRSLYARYRQVLGFPAELPPDGYHGFYMIDLARDIAAEKGDYFLSLPPEEAIPKLGEIGKEKILASIKADLELLGVTFDNWFSEKSLYEGGQLKTVMSILRERGYIAEKEGATWFVSTSLGEDKDNVLVRTSGTPTYFATDCAYHYNKFLERKFDRVINIWGADHQGHVPRMKAAVSALGIAPEQLQVIITQMVTLRRGETEVRASKRSGDIITLRELIEEVGADACRFFFLSRSADSQMDFDIELAKRESSDNPVYYVQYAYARIASILRLAQDRGIDYKDGDTSLLTTSPELALIRKILELPEVIESITRHLNPDYLPYYAQELATIFHSFYEKCRVISKDEALTRARLKLVKATKLTLAKILYLMGMTAPERM